MVEQLQPVVLQQHLSLPVPSHLQQELLIGVELVQVAQLLSKAAVAAVAVTSAVAAERVKVDNRTAAVAVVLDFSTQLV